MIEWVICRRLGQRNVARDIGKAFQTGPGMEAAVSMVITVKLGGSLRERAPGHVGGELSLELEQGAWVSEAVRSLGFGADDVALLMLNGVSLTEDKVLTAGDRLALFPKSQAFVAIGLVNLYHPAVGLILRDDTKKIT